MEAFDPDLFLGGYASAFAAGEAERIATFYAAPCYTIRADGSTHVLGTPQEIAQFFVGVLDAYRAEGMVVFAAQGAETRRLGMGCTELTCNWSMRRADETEIRAWRQTYLFQREAAAWRIAVSVLHAP